MTKNNKDKRIPVKGPLLATKIFSAYGYKSVKDKVIIIPAEKDKAKVSSLLLFDLEKNTIKLPTTVDNPARSDKIKGKNPWLFKISSPIKIVHP